MEFENEGDFQPYDQGVKYFGKQYLPRERIASCDDHRNESQIEPNSSEILSQNLTETTTKDVSNISNTNFNSPYQHEGNNACK